MNETEVPTGESEASSDAGGTHEAPGPERLKTLLEAALLAAGQPLSLNQLNALFDEDEQPGHGPIREALALLDSELADRAVELVEVAGGYRLQIRQKLMPVVSKLWAERPPRYSRALLETLAIIAYKQPVTRGAIEDVRGVQSGPMVRQLMDMKLVQVVGRSDELLGKPLLMVGLVVGLMVGIFQAVTQIHEMTLTFIPKILAIAGLFLLLMPWMILQLVDYTIRIFQLISQVG